MLKDLCNFLEKNFYFLTYPNFLKFDFRHNPLYSLYSLTLVQPPIWLAIKFRFTDEIIQGIRGVAKNLFKYDLKTESDTYP